MKELDAMVEEPDIPKPIRFNPFKHHRNYIIQKLESASSVALINQLEQICNNYIDIYTGELTPLEIGSAVILILKSKQVILPDDFDRWLASKSGYQQIKLEDKSDWVVRKSIESDRYIHLHPARSGFCSVRFKGSTLKTVYQIKASMAGAPDNFSLEKVNLVRLQIGLSPVKKLDRNRGILNCFQRLFSGQKV